MRGAIIVIDEKNDISFEVQETVEKIDELIRVSKPFIEVSIFSLVDNSITKRRVNVNLIQYYE